MISSTKIKDYLSSDKRDFKMFKIKLSKGEQQSISELEINSSNSLNYYGDLNSLDFEDFFSKIGKNSSKTCKTIESVIKKITKKVLGGFNRDNCWISVRASKPNNNFDIPRWHYDGTYFKNISSQAKFAMVLKGPGTLVIKKSSKVETAYEKIKNQFREEYLDQFKKIKPQTFDEDVQIQMKLQDKYRPIYAKAMSKFKIRQLDNDQGIVFWGGNDHHISALHSEPKIDEPRLFISILPGSKENIMEWKNKTNVRK